MPAPTQAQLQAANSLARQAVLAQSVEMTQQIFSQTVTPASNNIINVLPRNIGLIKGFIVEVIATVTNTSAAALALSDFNVANVLSNITFTDLNNIVRISTTGWHLNFVDTVKRLRVYGASIATDSPIKYGSNWNVISASATVAASGTGQITMKYWVPLAYSNTDLRGVIYANVINATMGLQLTLNTSNFATTSGDSTGVVYTGNGAATMSSATVNVYQVYLDQLPMGQNGPILPTLDLATIYELKTSNFTGLTPSQDFSMPFSNFRRFLSTFMIYYNGSGRSTGADINYLALQASNTLNIKKVSPSILALQTRNLIGTDFPPGVYLLNTRDQPINTSQYGNMQVQINPITAGAGAYVLVGYEDFANLNTVTQAGSLASS